MKIFRAGEQAVVLSLPGNSTAECVDSVRRLLYYLQSHSHPGIESIRPGLDSVLVEYSFNAGLEAWLQEMSALEPASLPQPQRHERILNIPVCYEMGQDLPGVSQQTGLAPAEIIELHRSREYQVWMIGFMPGFPYLGELAKPLQIERKKNPDPLIAAGSVAIAEEFVGIYPFDSPGGWHVIGRTPLKIIDYSKETPWICDYGMTIRFQPISGEEYKRMEQQ